MKMQMRSHPRRLAVAAAAAVAVAVAAIAGAQGALPVPGGGPGTQADSRALPPGKQAVLDRVARFRAALPRDAAAKAAAIAQNAGPPVDTAAEPAPLNGILETGQAPFAPGEYSIVNRWQELHGATLHQVYAGADAADPSQGLVVEKLILWPQDRDLQVSEYRTPEKDGALRVVSVDGNRVILSAENGRQFVFDTAANRFVSP